MAEGGAIEEGLHTLSSDSEFNYDFYCELCKDEGKNVEAEGFCVDCGEYLCGVCYTSHQRTRQTRHHELLDKDMMPKDTPLSSDRISKDISTKCKLHSGKFVKFYCKTDGVLGCSTCIVEGHRSCSGIESILEKSDSIWDSQEYKDVTNSLTCMAKCSRDTIAKARANITKTKDCYSEVLQSIKLLREDILKTLDKLEQDIISEADDMVSNEEKEMEAISNNCDMITETIETILAQFDSLQSSRRVCQLYISMKESSEQIKALQGKMRQAEEALVVKPFIFEANRKFQAFIKCPTSIGKILFDGQTIIERQQANANSPSLMKTVHVADNTFTRGNDYFAFITGSAALSADRLITVDCNNYRIEISDPQTNNQISELFVSESPFDVTLISTDKASVTVWEKILILNMSDGIEVDREISVVGRCCGLAYSKDRLVVSYTDPPKLEIMDMFGSVKKRIEKDCDERALFKCPKYVCVSNDGNTIYVSDQDMNTVTCLTFDGVVKSVYTDNNLICAEKVCVDHHGNVYVCGLDSSNVHMLTADLAKIKIILTEADGLDRGVMSISHCQETHSLYVGIWDTVKVFQLS